MRWWKFGIYGSVAWVLVVIAAAGGLLWYVSSHPIGPKVDEAREEKVGELAGVLLGAGLVAIWAYAYIRHMIRGLPEARPSHGNPARSAFAPCPACSSPDARKVTFTWWGGLLGPALFNH